MNPNDMQGRPPQSRPETRPDSWPETPDKIAVELEKERNDLAGSIDGLRDRLSVDSLIDDVTTFAKAQVGPGLHVLDGAVRSNPMAAVMAGVGLAWLVLGRKSGEGSGDALAGTKFEAMTRWEDEGGQPAPLPEPDLGWLDQADQLRDEATRSLSRIDAASRGQFRPAAETARQRAQVLADLAKTTRMAMLRGLDHLATESRDRVLAARERAYGTRISALRQTPQMIEERPLVAGAIALGLGVAVAVVLPRTRTEDRLLGPERDRLMARAQSALQQEGVRAANVATRLADTVTTEVQDSARTLLAEAP